MASSSEHVTPQQEHPMNDDESFKSNELLTRLEDSRYAQKVEELRKAFALFDRDGTGSIDRYELEQCLHSVGIHPTPAEMDALYSSMDQDNDGTIDFVEFLNAMIGTFEEQELEEELSQLRDMFALVDRDGSGRLSPEELQDAIQALGVNVDHDVCLQLFRDMGQKNPELGVSLDEFAMFLLREF
jgi:calmodulin